MALVGAVAIAVFGVVGGGAASTLGPRAGGWLGLLDATGMWRPGASEIPAALNVCDEPVHPAPSTLDFGSVPILAPYFDKAPPRLSVEVVYTSPNVADFPVTWSARSDEFRAMGFVTEGGSARTFPGGTSCSSMTLGFAPRALIPSELQPGSRSFSLVATSPGGAVLGSIELAGNATAAMPSACAAFVLFDSRSSGLPNFSKPGLQFALKLRALVANPDSPAFAIDLTDYPASPLLEAAVTRGVPAIKSAAALGPYRASVKAGETWLSSTILTQQAACPSSKLILSGYGQGAEVTANVYQSLSRSVRSHIAGVVLFADPYFNPVDRSARGSFSRARHGALGVRKSFSSTRVFSYCHAGDPICQGAGSPISPAAHRSYDRLGEPMQAAKALAAMIG